MHFYLTMPGPAEYFSRYLKEYERQKFLDVREDLPNTKHDMGYPTIGFK